MSQDLTNRNRQILRFGLVGIANNAFGYLLYLIVTYCGVPPLVTMTVLYLIGASLGFVGNRSWVFAYGATSASLIVRYALVQVVGYLLNFVLMLVFAVKYGYPHQLVQAIAIGVVAAYLFVAYKYFVYSRRLKSSDKAADEAMP